MPLVNVGSYTLEPRLRDEQCIAGLHSHVLRDVTIFQQIVDFSPSDMVKSEMYVEALQLACLRGHLDVVDKLLSVGVDPNQVDGHGWTATMCAMHSQRDEIRERLELPTDDEKWQPPSDMEILALSRLSGSDKSPILLLSEDELCVTYTSMSQHLR